MKNSFIDLENKESYQGFELNLKRILSRSIRYWYFIVISLGVTLTIAFYKTRYSLEIFPITSSILIKEMQETSGAELLYKNALIDQYRNYLNEPYIITSYPLIEQVVRELNFYVAFYREGYFMTTEAYNYVPVKAEWCNPAEVKTGQFIFSLINNKQFSLSRYFFDASQGTEEIFTLGDSIQFGEYHLCIRKIPSRSLDNFIGTPFLLSIKDPKAIASYYIDRIEVEWTEEGSGIINLRITGSEPEKEIDFLNQLFITYSELDLEKKNEAATRTIEFISNQLAFIKDSLKTVEFQLERFGNNSRVKDISSEAQRLFIKLENFEIQKTELLTHKNYYEYLTEYMNRSNGRLDQVILPSALGISDPILSSLLSHIVNVQLEIKSYLEPERGKNPLFTSKLNQIDELKANVEEAIRTLTSTDQIKMNFLNKQIDEIEKQLEYLPASERQLIAVQRNYSLLENMYVFLMQKLSEAGISKAANVSDIAKVNPPMKGDPIEPKPIQNYAIAFLAGLIIPIAIFVLLELANTKIQSKEDVEKISKIPFVGGIGHNSNTNTLIVKDKPKSGVAESFRALRSNLNFFTENRTKQVFMVSSSISGEGKTFTTINLATVFALSGKRTLIVGADMRRPKIFEDFKRENNIGLSNYLSGLSEFDEIIQDTDIDNLYFISGGPVPPNPSELLMRDRFEAFISIAKEQFDFLIIDTPPLALVTDAFVISKFVDHTVFVLRQNYSPKEFIMSIDEYFRSGKLTKMSILLNDIYKSGLGYGYGQGYAYNYGYGYNYGSNSRKGNRYYEDDNVLKRNFFSRWFGK